MVIAEAQIAQESELREALNLFVRGRAQRQQAAEKARKHAELLPLCRQAKDKFERLNNIDFPAAQARLEQTWQLVENAEVHLGRHLDRRPSKDNFPTQQELELYDARTNELNVELEQARAASREANAERDRLVRELTDAGESLARLRFAEKNLRPAETPGSSWESQLTAVR